ncbi:MAG: hypothetical protein ACQES8_00655 [Thermodesulfobacteriota bacterium]
MRSPSLSIINLFWISLLILVISSCTNKEKSESIENFPLKVDFLLILPVDIEVAGPDNDNGGQIAEGAITLSSILKNKAASRKNTMFLSRNQVESLLGDYKGSEQEIIHYLGKETGADAVLQTRIFHYIKRTGNKYSVSQPASVNFSYRLIHISTGGILCQGQFDETQEPLFSDLFSFFKASSRGFKWITAEELLKEGAKQEFDGCIYLN